MSTILYHAASTIDQSNLRKLLKKKSSRGFSVIHQKETKSMDEERRACAMLFMTSVCISSGFCGEWYFGGTQVFDGNKNALDSNLGDLCPLKRN